MYLKSFLASARVSVPVSQGFVRRARDDRGAVGRPVQLEDCLQVVRHRATITFPESLHAKSGYTFNMKLLPRLGMMFQPLFVR